LPLSNNRTKSDLLRILTLGGVLGIVLFIFVLRLAQIQIADGASYLEQQQSGDTKVQTLKAARGEIVDRNGSPFAYNEVSYSIVLDKALSPAGSENETVAALISLLRERGESWNESLPLVLNETGGVSFAADSDTAVSRLRTFLSINSYASADEVFYWLRERYDLSDYSDEDALAIAAVRYEMERTGYSLETRYTFAENVSQDTAVLVSQLKSTLSGVDVEEVANRAYVDGDLAPHIIGRVGAIISDEMDLYLEKGYSMNDTVGREGIERAYEDVLRGTDGERLIERDASYNVTDVTESSAAVPGDTVVLTIDKNIQRAAMEALKEEIAYLNANAPEGQGREADAGAVVAIDIKTSEVLACVTYPTYNLETYAEDFAANSSDPLNPFWNRALSGVYAPGSTFKPTVAIAGLTEGIITPETQVQCARVYT
jgi:penicillin-binding protein 2